MHAMSDPWILKYAEALGEVISPLQGLVPAGPVEMLEGVSRSLCFHRGNSPFLLPLALLHFRTVRQKAGPLKTRPRESDFSSEVGRAGSDIPARDWLSQQQPGR